MQQLAGRRQFGLGSVQRQIDGRQRRQSGSSAAITRRPGVIPKRVRTATPGQGDRRVRPNAILCDRAW